MDLMQVGARHIDQTRIGHSLVDTSSEVHPSTLGFHSATRRFLEVQHGASGFLAATRRFLHAAD